MTGLAEFNDLTDSAARRELLACCNAATWADAVASGRPYTSAEDLLAASDRAVAALSQADLAEALAGHPRIGDRALTGPSAREQAGVSAADPDLADRLAAGNAEYERRFGHIYLACATGRDAASLLAFLRQRLANDPDTEWRVVAGELAKINQIRLRALVDPRPSGAVPVGSVGSVGSDSSAGRCTGRWPAGRSAGMARRPRSRSASPADIQSVVVSRRMRPRIRHDHGVWARHLP